MSVDNFLELKAEEMLYPRGERRADARHAINTWWIATTMGGVKESEYQDYIPTWNNDFSKRQQTVAEAVHVAIKTTAMMGGTFH